MGPDGRRREVEAIIDTGFTGFLTLPRDAVAALGDGSVVVLYLYLATVLWHEQEREVLVLQAEGGALVGMSLLYGNRVVLDVVEGGEVIVAALP